MPGSTVARGSGKLGFAEVNVSNGTLTFDPAVRYTLDLKEPGPDPLTMTTDGRIRLHEMGQIIPAMAVVSHQGNAAGDDVTFTGVFDVAAVEEGLPSPLDVFDGAQVSMSWADGPRGP